MNAHAEHLDDLPRRPSPRCDFDRAILKLTGYSPKAQRDGVADGRLAAMRAALDNLPTIHQIRDWRKGKPAPQWARELLAKKLEEYGECAAILRAGSSHRKPDQILNAAHKTPRG